MAWGPAGSEGYGVERVGEGEGPVALRTSIHLLLAPPAQEAKEGLKEVLWPLAPPLPLNPMG